jgi:hypothetical protein
MFYVYWPTFEAVGSRKENARQESRPAGRSNPMRSTLRVTVPSRVLLFLQPTEE